MSHDEDGGSYDSDDNLGENTPELSRETTPEIEKLEKRRGQSMWSYLNPLNIWEHPKTFLYGAVCGAALGTGLYFGGKYVYQWSQSH